MKYALVATPQYLLCVDLISKTATPIEGARGEYYGVSWFPNQDELALSHSGLDNNTLIDIASYAQSEIGYISCGQQMSKPFLSQPHQILCAPDGRIICSNTGRNVVTVIDLNKPGLYHEAGVSTARWDRLSLELKTGDHINSVFLKNDQLFVICHRFDKGALLATFAYPSLELISLKPLKGLSGLHNIWVTDQGQQISCHSEAGSLVDLQSGELLWDSGMPIFTRGLAASEEYLIVGESQKTGRHLRDSSLSALWILERDSWKVMDYICLGPYGCVNEVRLLDVPDAAHHGIAFAGVEALLQHNMYQKQQQRSIERSFFANNTGKTWKHYKLVLGNPELNANGSKKAAGDNLCIAIQSQPHDAFSFDYSLSPNSADAHVSAVLGYDGGAADKNMHAVLVQKVGDNAAALSLWCHDNVQWQLIDGVSVGQLPLTGSMGVKLLKNEIVIFINQKEKLRLNPEKLGLKNLSSGFGIRWIGAEVKPHDAFL